MNFAKQARKLPCQFKSPFFIFFDLLLLTLLRNRFRPQLPVVFHFHVLHFVFVLVSNASSLYAHKYFKRIPLHYLTKGHFAKWDNIRLKTYQLVLVSCNSSEHGFREDVSPELFRFQVNIRISWNDSFSPFDNVNSRLVTMHRIENNL